MWRRRSSGVARDGGGGQLSDEVVGRGGGAAGTPGRTARSGRHPQRRDLVLDLANWQNKAAGLRDLARNTLNLRALDLLGI
jgi:hypothetical protein